jgi:hypothetical protein
MAFVPEKKALKEGKTRLTNSLVKPETPPYADPQRKTEEPKKNFTSAEENAPNKDKPTTADAKKGELDIFAAMAKVDPQGLSSITPMFFSMMSQVAAAAEGSSETQRKQTVEDALSGALAILSNKYTFEQITLVFDIALENNGIELIDAKYRSVVKNALINLYKNYLTYGEGNLPETVVDTVTEIGVAPSPIVTVVPDLYVKQYYTKATDPYPGYIQWLSQEGTDSVFTTRSIGDPYYTSSTSEVYSEAETQLAVALEPYIIEINLTATILNDLLLNQDSEVETSTADKTGGKNSAQKLMSILTQLAGYAGKIANLQQSVQLPVSVLNQGSVKKSHEAFMKNIGELRQAKDKARQGIKAAPAITGLLSSVPQIQKIAATAPQVKRLYDKIQS